MSKFKKLLDNLFEFEDDSKIESEPVELPEVERPPRSEAIIDSSIVSETLQQQEDVSFDELYQKVCTSDVNIFKLEEILLNSPELLEEPLSIRARTIGIVLRQLGTSSEHLIQDAVQKDQALDQLETSWHIRKAERERALSEQIVAHREEISRFAKQKEQAIDELLKQIAEGQNSLQHKIKSKLAEEKRIYDLVNMLTQNTPNPITLGSVPPTQNMTNKEDNNVQSEIETTS